MVSLLSTLTKTSLFLVEDSLVPTVNRPESELDYVLSGTHKGGTFGKVHVYDGGKKGE